MKVCVVWFVLCSVCCVLCVVCRGVCGVLCVRVDYLGIHIVSVDTYRISMLVLFL